MSPSPKETEEEVEETEEEEEAEEFEEESGYEEVTDEEEEESEAEEEQNPNPKPKPSVPDSISTLQSLNSALSGFLHHYNSLQLTLDSINSSFGANSGHKPIKIEPAAAEDRQFSELESICRISSARALRKYIITNLGNIDRLRREVPEALKLAPIPEKLVLDAMGKFYLLGSRAYRRLDPNVISTRRACILLLEFYVFAGCPVAASENPLSASVKESAREAAVSWRNRLIRERLATVKALDALGLVLLVASFGVPSEFGTNDLYSLLRLSNLKKKGDVLRRSLILVQKMPDIIKDLICKDMHVEAVDLVCTFGLEEKFPPLQLLSSFVKKEGCYLAPIRAPALASTPTDVGGPQTQQGGLGCGGPPASVRRGRQRWRQISFPEKKACEVGVEERRESQCSLRSLKEANEKQLAALKSVVKCLEDHKLDATELASLKIDQKIDKCEEEISKAELKLRKNVKRKFEDVDPLKIQDSQAKQLCPSAEASHFPVPQSVRQSQEQGITAISDSRYACNDHTANNMLVSSEASHRLVDRNNLELLARNVHGHTRYQISVGMRTPYSPGYDYTRYSAAEGENVYQPHASGKNIYQPPKAEHIYQLPASGQNICHSLASGQNIYQQPAPGTNMYEQPTLMQHFYQPPVSALVTGDRNLFQFADTVSKWELRNYSATSNPVHTASTVTNPSHQSSYAR